MKEGIASALKNWVPYQLYFNEGKALCKWFYLHDKSFIEPFFDDTISLCKNIGNNSNPIKCISSPDILSEWFSLTNSVEPSVFVFHVSRCGSTLLSQLLSLNEKYIVLSEVPFFDALLRWRNLMPNADEEKTLQLLQASIACYAQKRRGDENSLIIKTDSWHIFFYHQFRKLYPHTPFVLLYRKPDEVIRSHQKRRGMQAVQGVIEPEIFGFDKDAIMQISLDEYMAMVLEKYYAAFLEIIEKDSLAFLVNYDEGAISIVEKIAIATGMELTEKDMFAMKERTNFHAKYPYQQFSEAALTSAIPAYQAKAFELYNQLEEKRKQPG